MENGEASESRDDLSVEQAHRAMFIFVENLWKRTGEPVELAHLLGDNQMLPEGGTADPAAWSDWLKAVAEARATDSTRIEMRLGEDNPAR